MQQNNQTTEHLVGILSALLQYLPAESPERTRTLAKFVEANYEKINRLIEIRHEYKSRLVGVDDEIDRQRAAADEETKSDMEAEWLSRRLDAGLFCAQVGLIRPLEGVVSDAL